MLPQPAAPGSLSLSRRHFRLPSLHLEHMLLPLFRPRCFRHYQNWQPNRSIIRPSYRSPEHDLALALGLVPNYLPSSIFCIFINGVDLATRHLASHPPSPRGDAPLSLGAIDWLLLCAHLARISRSSPSHSRLLVTWTCRFPLSNTAVASWSHLDKFQAHLARAEPEDPRSLRAAPPLQQS